MHPAGPGGGCSDAAPTGPRAARPGLPAPGTHRVPASPRLPGSAGRQGRKERRRGGLLCSAASPASRAAALRSPLRRRSGPAPPPGSHFGSGGPVAITAQQLTRRRSGAGGSGGGGGARQGGSSRGGSGLGPGGGGGGGGGSPTSRELSADRSAGMQPWVDAMLSVAEGARDEPRLENAGKPSLVWRAGGRAREEPKSVRRGDHPLPFDANWASGLSGSPTTPGAKTS